MIFIPRYKIVRDIDVKTHGVRVERVYATKLASLLIHS